MISRIRFSPAFAFIGGDAMRAPRYLDAKRLLVIPHKLDTRRRRTSPLGSLELGRGRMRAPVDAGVDNNMTMYDGHGHRHLRHAYLPIRRSIRHAPDSGLSRDRAGSADKNKA